MIVLGACSLTAWRGFIIVRLLLYLLAAARAGYLLVITA
jgi:hypothetical protein